MNTFKPREKQNLSSSGISLFKKMTEKMPDISDDNQFPNLNNNLCNLIPTLTRTLPISTSLDFLDASTKITSVENTHQLQYEMNILNLGSGWVQITKNYTTNKSIIMSFEENDNTNNNYQEEVNGIIENMTHRWNDYKKNYIDLYGEDAYLHYYTTSTKENNYDSDMYDE